MHFLAYYLYHLHQGSELLMEQLTKDWPECITYENTPRRTVFSKFVIYKSPAYDEFESYIANLNKLLINEPRHSDLADLALSKTGIVSSIPTPEEIAGTPYVTFEGKCSSVPYSAILDGKYIAHNYPNKIIHIHYFSWMAIVNVGVRKFIEEENVSGAMFLPFYEVKRKWHSESELQTMEHEYIPDLFALRSSVSLTEKDRLYSVADFEELGLPDVVQTPPVYGNYKTIYCLYSRYFAERFVERYSRSIKIVPFFLIENYTNI